MRAGWIWVALVVAAACGDARQTAPEGTLRLAGLEAIPTLDPARGYDSLSWEFTQALFDTLVDYDAEVHLVAELARAWRVERGGRRYRFKLRTDALFHTGERVRSTDVRAAIERVLRPGTRSPGAEFYRGIVGARAVAEGRRAQVAGITTGPGHITFRLSAPDPLFLHKLALPFAAAIPAARAAAAGEDFGRHPVGSGPFALAAWEPGRHLVLERNPHYFRRGVPRIERIERQAGVNTELAWLRFEAGEIDLTPVPAGEFPTVVRDPRYRALLLSAPRLATNYIGINCQMPPFDRRAVRQALNYAVDKQRLLRLLNGRGTVARGVLPPGMPGHQPGRRGYPHDPPRARQLLRRAGYRHGISTTLWTRADETSLLLAQAVQQDLAAVGVRLRVKPVAWGPFLEAIRTPGRVPLFALGWWADFPDPANFLTVLFHSRGIGSNNNTFHSVPRLDSLLDRATEASGDLRAARFSRAEDRIVHNAPWLFLYHPKTYIARNPRVRGYRLHPLRPGRFEEVELAAGQPRRPVAGR